MSKQPPPAPTTSAVGPCPTVIQIVGRPGTGSLPSTIAPPDHPRLLNGRCSKFAMSHYISYITNVFQTPYQNDVAKIHTPYHHVAIVTCIKFDFKHDFKSPKDTIWCYMQNTYLCIKFTNLGRCFHYLMITSRTISFAAISR